jgi:hypothetical protein
MRDTPKFILFLSLFGLYFESKHNSFDVRYVNFQACLSDLHYYDDSGIQTQIKFISLGR